MSCSCYFFPSPQKNTGWPWRGEVWGNSVMWPVCMSVLLFHWAPFLQFRNTDVRVYHRYTLNRLQTATVRRRELTNYYKQTTANSAWWFNSAATTSCPVSTINTRYSAACCMTGESFCVYCKKLLRRVFFPPCLHKNYFYFKDNLISKVTKTEMHHEKHQMQVIRLTEL